MKLYTTLIAIVATLICQALGDINDPTNQWTDVVLVRTSKDGVSCTMMKTSISDPEDLKRLHEGVKKWAISKGNKSWIYAVKINNKTIDVSISSVISEEEADTLNKVLSRLGHKFDIDKIKDKANK